MNFSVCGIDSSTQSCTLITRDVDTGKFINISRSLHPKIIPNKSEQDPESWWEALLNALQKIEKSSIKALSIDGQGHGSVLLGQDNSVLRPAKLWNNTETGAESDFLINSLGKEQWINRTCIVPVPAFTITKLLWVKKNEPEIFNKIAKVLLPHDYLTYKLTDNYVTDRSEASGTGYFNPATSLWQLDLLNLVDSNFSWESMVPHVAGPDELVGKVTTGASLATGIQKGALLACGCNDNPASALGLGLQETDVCVSLGTSGTIFVPSVTPVYDYTGRVNGNADATGKFLPLVCTLNATKVTNWITSLFRLDYDEASALALSAKPTSNRPILIPFFDGERTPNLPLASGSISGLRTDTSIEEILRSCFEGVLLNILGGLDALQTAGVDTSGRLIVTGGGAMSPAYVQFLADLSGRPVWVTSETNTAAMGACVQAAAVFHSCSVSEIKKAWAPKLTIGAIPRDNQNVDVIKERYLALVKEEELRATSEIT